MTTFYDPNHSLYDTGESFADRQQYLDVLARQAIRASRGENVLPFPVRPVATLALSGMATAIEL